MVQDSMVDNVDEARDSGQRSLADERYDDDYSLEPLESIQDFDIETPITPSLKKTSTSSSLSSSSSSSPSSAHPSSSKGRLRRSGSSSPRASPVKSASKPDFGAL